MGYYIRILGTESDTPGLDDIREAASPALIEVSKHSGALWTELILKHPSGEEIALIERNETGQGLGSDELAEFIEEVGSYKPVNAAHWLKIYLPKVKAIYAFQVLPGTDVEEGWSRLHAVYSKIWNNAKGILQADGEGFSNEDGNTILWQFDDNVSGRWNVAVLNGEETWTSFEMNLEDPVHRAFFQRGEVPPNAVVVKKDQA